MRHHRGLAGLEAGLGGEVLGGIGLDAAFLALVEQGRRLEHHQRRRLDLHPGLGERVLDALVLADRPAEDDALLRILGRALDRYPAEPGGLGAEQHAFGVEPLQQDAEALAFLADAVFLGHEQSLMNSMFEPTAWRPILGIRRVSILVAVERGVEQRSAPRSSS